MQAVEDNFKGNLLLFVFQRFLIGKVQKYYLILLVFKTFNISISHFKGII